MGLKSYKKEMKIGIIFFIIIIIVLVFLEMRNVFKNCKYINSRDKVNIFFVYICFLFWSNCCKYSVIVSVMCED